MTFNQKLAAKRRGYTQRHLNQTAKFGGDIRRRNDEGGRTVREWTRRIAHHSRLLASAVMSDHARVLHSACIEAAAKARRNAQRHSTTWYSEEYNDLLRDYRFDHGRAPFMGSNTRAKSPRMKPNPDHRPLWWRKPVRQTSALTTFANASDPRVSPVTAPKPSCVDIKLDCIAAAYQAYVDDECTAQQAAEAIDPVIFELIRSGAYNSPGAIIMAAFEHHFETFSLHKSVDETTGDQLAEARRRTPPLFPEVA